MASALLSQFTARAAYSPTKMNPRSLTNEFQVNATTTTLKSGAPLGDKLNSLLLGPKGPNLLADVAFIEETAHFNRERIPERVVHAKGASALGQFVVTSGQIGGYTSASLFSAVGKSTPVVARFSHVTGESGISDTARDFRGFAVKFFTEQGNWDLVGNNFPVFFIRDPINFVSFIHSQKRNPKTHLKDPDAFWDFISLMPESLHAVAMLFSERGVPESFRHMHGYGVNTFKLVNSQREAFYAKFHWICNQGIKSIDQEAADTLAGREPDYMLRDLSASIERGEPPSWTLKFQVIKVEDVDSQPFNLLDVTKVWPTADFPLIEIGRMTLDGNVRNYFAQVEQLAFSPANLVPGIEPSPDKMLVGRMFAYPDAQRYRLGANYADLPCNRPRCPVVTPTYCDGAGAFQSNTDGALPNYLPSVGYPTLKGRDARFIELPQQFSGHTGRYDLSKDDNYSQVRVLVNRVLDEEGRRKLAWNVAQHLRQVLSREIVDKVLQHFRQIETTLATGIERHMNEARL